MWCCRGKPGIVRGCWMGFCFGPGASIWPAPVDARSSPDIFICAKYRGHEGKQNQAPKQLLGVVTLHAVCEDTHVVVVELSLQVVWTGPLPARPFP